MSELRYDVIYATGENFSTYVYIAFHHCSHGEGCYGYNPNHGLTWDEACVEASSFCSQEADRWLLAPEDLS